MRFLGVTETCDLGALYLSLVEEGHEVKIFVGEPEAQGTLAGLVPRTPRWEDELEWVRAAGDDGIIIFEAVSEGFGALQDRLRRDGYRVVGGSEYGDRIENDRAFAQKLLADLGFPAGHIWEFSDGAAADSFLEERPGRYVLKFSGPGFSSSDNYVGQWPDGRDVRAVLAARLRQMDEGAVTFVLMEYIDGIEMGVGAYFDGTKFLEPACLDWEHKRFFAGDLGELTGEMGTVATYDGSRGFFERTLKLVEPHLRAAGHVGYVNMNTIVNQDGIWPLEFTSRFGYPGFAILAPLQETPWSQLLRMMATGGARRFAARPGFSVGIVLTTPPFPYSRKQVPELVGLPVLLADSFTPSDRAHLYYGEVGLEQGQLVTSGLYGWTMVVTGVAATIEAARREAYARAAQISIPQVRYRLDIGQRLIDGDLERVRELGHLG